jgi:hypothetical protein
MTAVVIGVAPLLLTIWLNPHFFENKSKHMATANFNSDSIISALADFFLFAIVSPLDTVRHYYVASDIMGYLDSPVRLIALIAWIAVFAFAVLKALRRTEDLIWLVGVVLLPMVLLVGFYTLINPQEVMLTRRSV